MKKIPLKFIILFFLLLMNFSANARDNPIDQILKTNTLRCGYGVSTSAYMTKDPNTGVFSGAYADIIQEAATLLNLKIEWTVEPGYTDFHEGLRQNRFDAFCSPIGIIPQRSRVSTSTIPVGYNLQIIYGLEKNKKFKTIADINTPKIRAATTDGESFQIMTRRFLPKATEHSLPNMTPPGQLMMDVAIGKADVILYDPVLVDSFNRDQKGKYKLVSLLDKPVSVTPTTVFTLHPDDTHLLNMLNIALNTLILNGRVDEILTKYKIGPDLIYRPNPPYQATP